MPLKSSTRAGDTIFAFNYDTNAWQALQSENRQHKHLVMPCCGRSVVVKTSHLGTQFFAHVVDERTPCARESEEHLLAKDLVAKAVIKAGWHAQTEMPLENARSTANVLATNNGRRVAFEIQWSRQTFEETTRRHRTYRDVSVRALWLFRQADYPMDHDIPAFRLVRKDGEPGFNVWVWSDTLGIGRRDRQASQEIELQTFITGALSGQLQWKPAVGLKVPVLAHISQGVCIKGHETRSLVSLTLDVARLLPGHANIPLSMWEVGRACPELLRSGKAVSLLREHKLKIAFGVSNLSGRWWDPYYERHALPCCAVCGDLIASRLDGSEEKPATDFELSLELSPDLLKELPELDARLARWWFDNMSAI